MVPHPQSIQLSFDVKPNTKSVDITIEFPDEQESRSAADPGFAPDVTVTLNSDNGPDFVTPSKVDTVWRPESGDEEDTHG